MIFLFSRTKQLRGRMFLVEEGRFYPPVIAWLISIRSCSMSSKKTIHSDAGSLDEHLLFPE